MKLKYLALVISIVVSSCAAKSPQVQSTSEQKPVLVLFSSDEGIARMRSAEYVVDFYALANYFESQDNGAVCGPTTAAIVLNALNAEALRSKQLNISKDVSSISQNDMKYVPKDADPFLNEYTQNNVFDASYVSKEANKNIKDKSIVVGKHVNAEDHLGFSIRQLDALFDAHGTKSELKIVSPEADEKTIRDEIVKNLSETGNFVVVNYIRTALGQAGGGHISPLGAYHKETDSVLVMDVNPSKADWVWVKMSDMIAAMRTLASVENRGYLLISK